MATPAEKVSRLARKLLRFAEKVSPAWLGLGVGLGVGLGLGLGLGLG